MGWLPALFRRKAREQKLDSELRFHLEQQIRDNVAGGMDPEEARRRAAIEFGGLEQIKERCRDVRSGRWLETTLQDLRCGIRALCRTPGFTSVALLTIGVGIGANVAIFSFFDATLLKRVPYPNVDRIVKLFEINPQGGWWPTSAPNYTDWVKQNTVFENMAAQCVDDVALGGIEIPVQLVEERVSANFFDVFRVNPIWGRTFVAGEDQPGRDNVAILSNKLWVSNFGADPEVIGRTITLDGKPNTVIGVMPPGGVLDRQGIEIFRPLAFTPDLMARDHRWLSVYAMLNPGLPLKQALAEMDTIEKRMAADHPKSNKGWRVAVITYSSSLVWNDLRQSLNLLMAAVGAVMLIACVNLANLTMARGVGREREVATRAALGAGRCRLMRQFLTESLLLSSAGGILGLLVGYGAMAALKMAPPGGWLPTTNSVEMDGRVLLFATGLSFLTGIIFGLIPAIKASRIDLAQAIKDGSPAASTGRRIRGLRGTLVVIEVALAFVLLSGAGLLMQSFFRIQKLDIGFDSKNLAETYLPIGKHFSSDTELNLYLHQVVDRIGGLPGVQDVALTTVPPLTWHGWGAGVQFQILGAKAVEASRRPYCGFKVVTPGYFHTLGIRLIKGRLLGDHDVRGTQPVTVISESMEKKYFPDGDSVGHHILARKLGLNLSVQGSDVLWEIVGVIGNERNDGPRDQDSPGMYVTEEQSPTAWQYLIVRSAMDPAVLEHSMRVALREVDRNQTMEDLFTFETLRSDYLATDRRRSMLFAAFAGTALLLAVLGIYGVVSHSVAQRTREIGIRAALGATSGNILRLVLQRGMRLTLFGLLVGVVGALGLSRFLASMLFHGKCLT